MRTENRPAGASRRRFATTRWSLVVAAAEGDAEGSEQALAELCATYWYPLYAYVRRRGHGGEDARDLTQAFFTKLLEKGDLGAADRARGRFRTFLLSSMKNFLAGEWRRRNALKRGGGVEIRSLDLESGEERYGLEPAHELDPEAIFERRWALALLERAVADLRDRYEAAGEVELFDALKGALDGREPLLPYTELAARLGRSEGSLRTAASRLRSRWRERLVELVAETVRDESEVEDELRHLIAAVSGDV